MNKIESEWGGMSDESLESNRKSASITSMMILIVMEVGLVLITAGTGLLEGLLQAASERLGAFMKS